MLPGVRKCRITPRSGRFFNVPSAYLCTWLSGSVHVQQMMVISPPLSLHCQVSNRPHGDDSADPYCQNIAVFGSTWQATGVAAVSRVLVLEAARQLLVLHTHAHTYARTYRWSEATRPGSAGSGIGCLWVLECVATEWRPAPGTPVISTTSRSPHLC